MTLLPTLADRLILSPSRQPIPAAHKERRLVSVLGQWAEVWIERTRGEGPPPVSEDQPKNLSTAAEQPNDTLPESKILIVKFNGAGGRAERTNAHPLDYWNDLPGEVWSPNPPGFGGSVGPATLRGLAPLGRAVFEATLHVAGLRPIFISGNSLGTAIALHVAAHFADVPNLAGLILRNPPALSQLIAGKFGWRTAGLSLLLARQIPRELDSLANAAAVRAPAVFLCSGSDRTVPPWSQSLVIDAYAGDKQVVSLPSADHVFVFDESDRARYADALAWLRGRCFPHLAQACPAVQNRSL